MSGSPKDNKKELNIDIGSFIGDSLAGASSKKKPKIEVQSIWIFILLCVLTGGLYPFLWTYNYWKSIEVKSGVKSYPFWKSLFHWVLAPKLFRHVQIASMLHGIKPDYSAALFGLCYYGLFILRFFGEPLVYFSILSFVPFVVIISTLHKSLAMNYEEVVTINRFYKSDLIFIVVFWISQISLLYYYSV